jgi:putative DNA primase/helicase
MGEPDGTIILAEGFATAASVRQATGHAAVVCFNCNNLGIVAGIMRRKYPAAAIIIAGDDDKWTDGNPGRTKAEETAAKVGAAAIFPVFKNPEKGKTDFNDLHCTEGLETVREQLTKNDVQPEPIGFIPLGFQDKGYYFYCLLTKTIVVASSFSHSEMLQIAPKDFWECSYMNKRGIDWLTAQDDLIWQCKRRGLFNWDRVRGYGAWYDSGRTIVNDGSGDIHIIGSKNIAINKFKSKYVYIKTNEMAPRLGSKSLSLGDAYKLTDICESFSWKEKLSGSYLAGWLAIARIAGGLPIRPHIQISADAGVGKSTIIESVVRPVLGTDGGGYLYVQGGSTTEAGIRQKVKADSIPLVIDEFDKKSGDYHSAKAGIVELLRQSWSATGGSIAKGSSSGASVSYPVNYIACAAGICIDLENEADRSRFSILELTQISDNGRWEILRDKISGLDPEFSERLFVRSVNMMKIIRENYERLFARLSLEFSSRFGQQHGMLMAGYYSLLSDTVISEDQIQEVVNGLKLAGQEKTRGRANESADCWEAFMAYPIRTNETKVYINGEKIIKNIEQTIGALINQGRDANPILIPYGIKINSQGKLCIVKNHRRLRAEVFRNTRWTSAYNSLILRFLNQKTDEQTDIKVTEGVARMDKTSMRAIIVEGWEKLFDNTPD